MSNRQMPVHYSLETTYRLETIECACGVTVTAERDGFFPERHGPLLTAWDAHRRKVGVGRVGMYRDGTGHWRRSPKAAA